MRTTSRYARQELRFRDRYVKRDQCAIPGTSNVIHLHEGIGIRGLRELVVVQQHRLRSGLNSRQVTTGGSTPSLATIILKDLP